MRHGGDPTLADQLYGMAGNRRLDASADEQAMQSPASALNKICNRVG